MDSEQCAVGRHVKALLHMKDEKHLIMESKNQFGKTSRISLWAAARDGNTFLKDVAFTAPYKIMAPFEKAGGGIQIMPLCASAGIMKGDCQEFDYRVGEGADLEILSQSFEKIHKMDGGSAARKIQIQVEKNAVLSYYPQPVIPFGGSAFDSNMNIHLADKSSRLFLLDIISCGRTAYEKPFSYRRFSSKVQIYRGDRLIYRDNTRYEPDKMPMTGIGFYEDYTHLANLFLTAPDEKISKQSGKNIVETGKNIVEAIWEILEDDPQCEGGVTCLAQGDLAIRIFGKRAQVLQNTASKIKKLFLLN